MLISKVTHGLLRNAVLQSENVVSLGITRNPKNTSHTKQLFIQNRYKKTSSDQKKRCEENPKKSRKLAKLATVAVVGTTVAVIVAKYDDDFRDWSKEHVPLLDGLVKIVFQEEETYLESLDRLHKELSAWIKELLYDAFKGNKEGKPAISSGDGDFDTEGREESKKVYRTPESAFLLDDKKEEDALLNDPTVKELKDLEDRYFKAAKEAMQAINSTIDAFKNHGKLIDYLDQIISSNNPKIWNKISKTREDASKGVEKSKKNTDNLKVLEQQFLSELGDNTSISDGIREKAQKNVEKVNKDVNEAAGKLDKEIENSVLAKRSWEKVKQARFHFSEELETLFPNVWLNDEKLNIPADQLEPFTQSVVADIEFLSKELAKMQTTTEAEINSALEKYKKVGQEASDKVVDTVVPYEENKEKRKQRAEIQKTVLEYKAKCEKNAKALVKQSAEVYADLTNEALKLKEKEVERKVQQQVEEKLAQLRAQHKMEIAKMVGRMQGANEAIANRGDKDKNQQEKQQFWSAAQSLMAAVKPIGGQSQAPKPLKNEITNVNKVKPEGDELVDTVLSTIPEDAVNNGIPTEACLKERFIKVMGCAQGWAGVPSGEISLLKVLLARVQSALYLNIAIPQAELDNEPAIDPEKLNNYDILFRAKYYVDKGEFDQAIRYLNLLKGPSSKVASDWVKDALVYLETRQAAELLLAHATALGMQS